MVSRYSVVMNEVVPPAESLPMSVRFRNYLKELALRIVVYLVLYLLISIATIGPFFWYWFEATYVGGERWIAKFYAPLLWLCDSCPPLSWLVNHYVDWWIK